MRNVFLLLLSLLFIASLSTPALANSSSEENEWYNKLNNLKSNEQVIVVTTDNENLKSGILAFYEKEKGVWKKVFPDIPVVIGRNGMTKNKKEGDGKTPSGVFPLGTAFGTGKKPASLKIPYRQTTKYDYWVDDPSSPDYNRWIHYRGNPKKRWKSFERLTHPLYKHAIVIRYNDEPVVKGRGSAIFIHIWNKPSGHTLGCIATSEANVLKIMKALDQKKNPIIVISTKKEKLQMLK